MHPKSTALIWVDLQVDFMPTGMLPVSNADQVIPLANAYAEAYETVVATQDWHPANHGSFAANHPWRKPGQTIELEGLQQVLWPIHCVQETWGAEFVADLATDKVTKVFQKGTDPLIDSYSGFYDNGHKKSTGLAAWLRERGVREVHVCGVATDYCVKFTALDAILEGFRTTLLLDACRGVNLREGDIDKAIREMREAGVSVVEQTTDA